jgi:hypothetical protein
VAWEIHYEHFVPNDDNRAADGLNLRRRFESETSVRLPDLGSCRMLEFLIALAIRLNEAVYNYRDPNQESYWFWQMMEHLELDMYTDDYNFMAIHGEIYDIFMRINHREYSPDGSNGGLFPLKRPAEDQRDVEIWYQMMAYLQENV